jgi:AAA domain/DnaB-like helicase N terminal domain
MPDDDWIPPDPPPDDGWDDQAPHDITRERWLLSALMHGGEAAADVALAAGWTPADMFRPLHEDVADAIMQLCGTGTELDPLAITDWMGPGRFGTSHAQEVIFDIWQIPVVASNAADYAAAVHALAIRRRLVEGGTRQIQAARSPGLTVAEALNVAESGLAAAAGAAAVGTRAVSPRVIAADTAVKAHNWVIPGMVDLSDRIIWVGWEGHGKTRLLYQYALAVACGVHPFIGDVRFDPQRTLMVNLEVGPGMWARTTEAMLEVADGYGLDDRYSRVWSPDDLDLRTPDGQMALTAEVRAHRPRLLCAGPMYHMGIAEGQAEGADYLTVAKYLHRLARRHGCALMLEQHAPMAQNGKARVLRPIGSVLWTKWPDFGWGLRPVRPTKARPRENRYLIERFRNPREVRAWPEALYWRDPRAGDGFGWPWVAEWPEGTLDAPMDYDTAGAR